MLHGRIWDGLGWGGMFWIFWLGETRFSVGFDVLLLIFSGVSTPLRGATAARRTSIRRWLGFDITILPGRALLDAEKNRRLRRAEEYIFFIYFYA